MVSVKEAVFNALLLQDSLTKLREHGIVVQGDADLAKTVAPVEERDFSPRIVADGIKMSAIYVAFFCLENAVRELISERLLERKGSDWWDKVVPTKIRAAVDKLKDREQKKPLQRYRWESLRSSFPAMR